MELGYRRCRECDDLWNVADLVGGLCPECARTRVSHLANLQRQYEDHLRNGDADASEDVLRLIREYTTAEGVRLKDARRA